MVRLFQDGEKVVHLSKGKVGKVIDFIGGEESRYYVQYDGHTWSVPERCLDSEKLISRVNNSNKLQTS